MSDVRLEFKPDGIRRLGTSQEVAASLGAAARRIRKRVVLPKRAQVRGAGGRFVRTALRTHVRWGVGKHGAYSQVIMDGPGAIQVEFGGRHQPALAPLRNALRGGR